MVFASVINKHQIMFPGESPLEKSLIGATLRENLSLGSNQVRLNAESLSYIESNCTGVSLQSHIVT